MTRGALRLGAALGAAALSTMTFAPAFATHDAIGEADASASTGQGPLFELLDTGMCKAEDTATTTTGNPPTGRCGDGLDLNQQITAFSQNASAPGDGTSAADASVAPINLTDLGQALNLQGILDGLAGVDTGTVLDSVVAPLGQGIVDAVNADPLGTGSIMDQVVGPVQTALDQALGAVQDNLPLSLQIGAVESWCKATSDPLQATGQGTLASLLLKITLGGQVIEVPIEVPTAPNSDLVVDVPGALVNGVIDSIEASLTASLGGALQPLTAVTGAVQEQVLAAILGPLEDQLLPPLSDALSALIKGTVNKQNPVSPSSTGEIDVTAVELILAGGQIGTINLGRVHCGPNRAGTPHGTPPPPSNPPPPPGEPGIPTQVDSGQGGTDTGTIVLMATGALMLAAGVTGVAGYRRLLQK